MLARLLSSPLYTYKCTVSLRREQELVRTFVERHPLAFSLLLTLVLFGLLFMSIAALPVPVVSSVADLPPEALERPSKGEQALIILRNPLNLFWALATLLAVVLLTRLGWWREAGFNGPSRWRNLHLLSFPLLAGMLGLLGGVRIPDPVLLAAVLAGILVATFGEEALYRGLMWRALAPKTGVMRAVVTTSLLSGVLNLGRLESVGPWPEAVYLAVLAICGSFTYAALRWRTASIWPVILLHLALNVAAEISTPGFVPYLRPLLAFAIPLVLLGYGLFLLRNPDERRTAT